MKLKIPGYPHKNKPIEIDASGFDAVRISIIFKRNKDMVKIIGCDDVLFGGTGYDPTIKLPDEVDNLEATPYGDYKERIEFLTRGCIRDCYFCLVRQKEGFLHEYRTLERILSNYNGEKIRFFDNNFLAWDKANEVMEILIRKQIPVSFNEGLDIRLINDENARLLSQLNYYPTEYIFAFDNYSLLPIIEEKTKILRKHITGDWKLKYYVFTDADKPIDEVLARVHWCKDHLILPYMMRYDNCYESQIRNFYTDISAWTNQAGHFKKQTVEEFMVKRHPKNPGRVENTLGIYNSNLGEYKKLKGVERNANN